MTEIQNWDGELLITKFDKPSGCWIYIAIHSTKAGPATGGTRMLQYTSPEDGLKDVLKLSQGMTLKFALSGFSRGGGKAVIALPKKFSEKTRPGLLYRYGELIKQLNGLYYTGPDVGTSSADMDMIAETADPYVFCKTLLKGGRGNSAYYTAYGLLHAMRSTVQHLDQTDSLEGRSVLIQGAGSVGILLIKLLQDNGAHVYASDTDSLKKNIIEDAGARFVEPAKIFQTPCEIFSPCALGGILNARTIPQLKCRAVVGAANNQLSVKTDAGLIKKRNILYAPDFAVNFGGALAVTGMEANDWSVKKAKYKVARVYQTLQAIFKLAEEKNLTTESAATQIASKHLAGISS